MKSILFARHGESHGNRYNEPIQGDDSTLTEQGRTQCKLLANRCMDLSVECIISSTLTRAMETSAIIAEKLGQQVESSPLFIERKRPSQQIGLLRSDIKAKNIEKEIVRNFGVPGYKLADEETFSDLQTRAEAALGFLATRPERRILVISHANILCFLLAVIVAGSNLNGIEAGHILETFRMDNLALTLVEHDSIAVGRKWRIAFWNDYNHLLSSSPITQ